MDKQNTPHVLIFPLPLQGPVKSMLKLAELICLSTASVHVTFLVTDFTLSSLLRHTNISSHFARYPHFSLLSIPDGLPDDHPRAGSQFMEILQAMDAKVRGPLKDLVSSRGVSCVIADGAVGFAVDVAEEVGVPVILSRTLSPCCLWVHYCLPKLVESGEVPVQENKLDALVSSVPGMESYLRGRDLPGYTRGNDVNDPNIQLFMKERQQARQARGIILNTYEDLDGPQISHIRTLWPNIYTIGPLHAHLKSRLAVESVSSFFSGSLREVDRSCLAWLDKQPYRSVIYVSFGSLATMRKEQLMEFWHGLVNSGVRFLWVIRSDSNTNTDKEGKISEQLLESRERGYIVEWAPQEEVLAHSSIGGFLTHAGWNSTLESVFEGVPMICWPYFLDQLVNSRFVGEVWKLGLDMKDSCDRVVIEEQVKYLMEVKRDEFVRSSKRMADLAKQSISPDGSSYLNLGRLIEDIKSMSQVSSHSLNTLELNHLDK